MAKSIDELMTSRSIVVRIDFTDFDMLDAMIASALIEKTSRQALSLSQESKVSKSSALRIPTDVNSTPTNTERTELHSMITFHHANTRGSGLHIFVSVKQLWSTCHVSFLAAPDTDHKHKFSLTHFIHFSYLSDGLTFTKEPYDSQPMYTLRCSTAEWRDQHKSHLLQTILMSIQDL